jgi:hypothetical protein
MTTFAERRQVYFDPRDLNTVMRAWGAEHGLVGRPGGWIYYTASGRPCVQGWWTVWNTNRESVLDWLTRRHTAFKSFEEVLSETAPTYRPTICLRNAETRCLAGAYDKVQAVRGDARRAYTYTRPRRVA